jgi:hypothetical protein
MGCAQAARDVNNGLRRTDTEWVTVSGFIFGQ